MLGGGEGHYMHPTVMSRISPSYPGWHITINIYFPAAGCRIGSILSVLRFLNRK